MDKACAERERAATLKTVGVSSPAILYILGIIKSSPCDAVKVVVKAPTLNAPWTAPAAPPSACISTTRGTWPRKFFSPAAAFASAISPIGDDGVMG